MKNVKKVLILALVLSALMCVSAFAGDTTIDTVTIDQQYSGAKLESEVKDRVQFSMSYSGTDGQMYLLMVLNNTLEEGKAPEAKDILYVNQETVKEDGKATFATVYPTEIKDSVIYLAGGDLSNLTKIGEIKANKPVGFAVGGDVESNTAISGSVTLELFASDTETASYTSVAENGAYRFENVKPGTYTMKVSKHNHAIREYVVVVVDDTVVQNVKIHALGDINGDNKVNITDVNKANAHAGKTKLLTGYELTCADVNVDGKVNITDVNRINGHAGKKTNLW